jgi:uncharacterized protein (TIGR02597 family)
MKIKSTLTLAMLLALSLTGSAVMAQQNVVGYNFKQVAPESDVVVTVPFTREAAGEYTVAADSTGATITVSETISDTYDDAYYVKITSGTSEGLWITTSSNTSNQITLVDSVDVSTNDTLTVYPHHTLESVFPDEQLDVAFEASIKHPMFPTIETYKTQLVMVRPATTGINRPVERFFYYNSDWRKAGEAFTDSFNNTVITPDDYLIVRNENSTKTLAFSTDGFVPFVDRAMKMTNGVELDLPVSTGWPVAMRLDELNLGGTDAFVDSEKHPMFPTIETYGDRLYTFTVSDGVVNPPNAIYFYYNGAWRKVGEPLTTSFDSVEIEPSEGAYIRKGTLGSGTHVWTNKAPY